MFLTIHAATGVIIGQTTNNVTLAFFFGLIFHFVLDMIPHGDQALMRKDRMAKIRLIGSIATVDAVIMGIFLSFIFNRALGLHYLPIAASVVGSILPDFFVGLAELTNNKIKWLSKFQSFHAHLHHFPLFENFEPNLKTGIVMQAIILVFLTGLIL
ncbi:hypothetical protein KKA15_05275 [Patescibacteria group bacterium]|nr:hypothetical protein [Patescibacteria group bacterium]